MTTAERLGFWLVRVGYEKGGPQGLAARKSCRAPKGGLARKVPLHGDGPFVLLYVSSAAGRTSWEDAEGERSIETKQNKNKNKNKNRMAASEDGMMQ